jgi:hypothetical protein
MLHVTFIHEGSFDAARAEVVGVVRQIRTQALGSDGRPQIYVPYLQSARVQLGFVVRAATPPCEASRPGAARTRGSRPAPRSREILPGAYVARAARHSVRFTMVIASALAALALLLACIGIFGLVSYSVAARTGKDRRAHGSGVRTIGDSRMVLAQILRLTATGLAVGFVVARTDSLSLGPSLRRRPGQPRSPPPLLPRRRRGARGVGSRAARDARRSRRCSEARVGRSGKENTTTGWPGVSRVG